MRRLTIQQDIINYLTRNYEPFQPITEETSLDELGLDSLDRVEFEQFIEDQFKIKIPDNPFWAQVKDAIDYVVIALEHKFDPSI